MLQLQGGYVPVQAANLMQLQVHYIKKKLVFLHRVCPLNLDFPAAQDLQKVKLP